MNHANHCRIFHPAHRPHHHPKKHRRLILSRLDMSLADGFGGPTHIQGIDWQITWQWMIFTKQQGSKPKKRCTKCLATSSANSQSGYFCTTYSVLLSLEVYY